MLYKREGYSLPLPPVNSHGLTLIHSVKKFHLGLGWKAVLVDNELDPWFLNPMLQHT